VRVDGPEPTIVLHHHKSLHRYLQFGGHIELTEDPWQAITHEILEESGYELDQLDLLQPPDRVRSLSTGTLHPVPLCYNTHQIGKDHFHTDASWAFVTDMDPRNHVGAMESNDIRRFSFADLLAASAEDLELSTIDICRFIFACCLHTWERLPATSPARKA
jgi:hypothetical protein